MLNDDVTPHLLTDAESASFEKDGFLHVPGALTSDAARHLAATVDRIYDTHKKRGFDPYTERAFNPHRPFFFPDFLPQDESLVNLLDHGPVFHKVWGILGWNIYCYHTHLIVTPPRDREDPRTGRLNFHQDSGRVNREMESHPRPRLSVKVVYWLSDCSQPDRGNLFVVPGSHIEDQRSFPEDGSAPSEATPICCQPGDAVIFDRRLWHSASPNESDVVRKGLFYGYGYRWLRPKDNMSISADMLAKQDPIRRQLMGDGYNANGHFSPRDEDVPLRLWLMEKELIK